MIGWAVTFLVVAIVAAVLGFTGIAGVATNIAWILFVVGLILAIVFAIFGRRAVYAAGAERRRPGGAPRLARAGGRGRGASPEP
jgi:uncharacterized membrane protein YtjA (UPF0391 family)